VSFVDEDGSDGKAPFKGACGNCFWGGQGYRCSLRAGGGTYNLTHVRDALVSHTNRSKVSPRSRRSPVVPVLQSELYRSVHVGARHNLGSAEGIHSALEEIESVRRSLQQRLRAVERGGELEEVGSEGSSEDEQNEDEEMEDDEEEDKEDVEDSFEGFSD